MGIPVDDLTKRRINIRASLNRKLDKIPKESLLFNHPVLQSTIPYSARLFNLCAWECQIYNLIEEIRWSTLEALSYFAIDQEIHKGKDIRPFLFLFRYYCDNAVYRIIACREKIAQLVNCYYNFYPDTTKVKFYKILRKIGSRGQKSIRRYLIRLSSCDSMRFLEDYRHSKMHREEPTLIGEQSIGGTIMAEEVQGDDENISWTLGYSKNSLSQQAFGEILTTSYHTLIESIVGIFEEIKVGEIEEIRKKALRKK
jgi:hypothetical protein